MTNIKDIALILCALCVFGGMLANGIFLACLFIRAARKTPDARPPAPRLPPPQEVGAPDQS